MSEGRKLKILFVGDAACSTGFALCTHQLCDRLHANGHDVTVLGINYYGNPHDYPYTIYPCVNPLDRSTMVCGEQRLPKLIYRLRPDIVIILQDPWNIRGYMREIEEQLGDIDSSFQRPLMIGWLAVDSKNQISGRQLNQLDHVVTWTQFGIDELRIGGYTGPHSIIGLGVDTSTYYPIDRMTARRSTLSDGSPLLPKGIPIDSYIIGVVGRNQTRKRLDLVLEYFAAWTRQHAIDNAYLYLHVGPTGEHGCNIEALLKYYGIKAIISAPPTSGALTTADMNLIYNCFDLFWSMSQAEGWNLPALEAMACGIPCLVPEQGAHAEWAVPAAELIECTSTALTAPMNRGPYTIGGIADRALTIEALDKLYRYASIRDNLSGLGLDLARKLSWDVVGEQWETLLQSISQSFRWSSRPSTMDEITIREVYRDNCYHIPDDLSGYTVIDVGASIGAFSRLCLERGAHKVIAIEPDSESFELLKTNTGSFGNIALIHGAAVGDACVADKLFVSPTNYRGKLRMTGGQNVFEVPEGTKESVQVIRLSALIAALQQTTDLHAYPILLKLDCEGSEYQIIYSDLPWDHIALIVGETHSIGDDHPFVERFREIGLGSIPHDHESLVARLSAVGYDVTSEDFYGTACGLLNFKAISRARFASTITDLMISPKAIDSALDNSPRCDNCGKLTCPGTLGYDCDQVVEHRRATESIGAGPEGY